MAPWYEVEIEFSIDDYKTDIPTEIEQVGEWVSYSFSSHFVLIEQSEKIIAGGCSDNKKAWDENWYENEDSEVVSYTLRCSEKDTTLFLLKFKGTEE